MGPDNIDIESIAEYGLTNMGTIDTLINMEKSDFNDLKLKMQNSGIKYLDDYMSKPKNSQLGYFIGTNKMKFFGYLNDNGRLHNRNGPAYHEWHYTGAKFRELYSVEGKSHREDGPADVMYHENGDKLCEKYEINGLLSRKNGPAFVSYRKNGMISSNEYRIEGKFHRIDGPAVVLFDQNGNFTYKAYYINNKYHNDSGPAVIKKMMDGGYQLLYYYHGELVDNHIMSADDFKKAFDDHSVSYENLSDGGVKETLYDKTTKLHEVWKNKDGMTDRIYDPAFTIYNKDGSKLAEAYFKNGVPYRTYGPSGTIYHKNGKPKLKTWRNDGKMDKIIYFDESGYEHHDTKAAKMVFYKNGKLKTESFKKNGIIHRVDDPAFIEYDPDGKVKNESYYVNGRLIKNLEYKNGKLKAKKLYDNCKLHNQSGPAVYHYDDNTSCVDVEYYMCGDKLTEIEFNKKYLELKEKIEPDLGKKDIIDSDIIDSLDDLLEDFRSTQASLKDTAGWKSSNVDKALKELFELVARLGLRQSEINDKNIIDKNIKEFYDVDKVKPLEITHENNDKKINEKIMKYLTLEEIAAGVKPKVHSRKDGSLSSIIFNNEQGFPHRLGGPAVYIFHSNEKICETFWCVDGRLHNENGPAFTAYNSKGLLINKEFYINDIIHREDGPASVKCFGDNFCKEESYYKNGALQKRIIYDRNGAVDLVYKYKNNVIENIEYLKPGKILKTGKIKDIPEVENIKNDFIEMTKNDLINSGYRIAQKQMSSGARSLLLGMMKDKTKAKSFIDSELGESLVSMLLGTTLSVSTNEKVERMAKEFRTDAMALAGNKLLDVVWKNIHKELETNKTHLLLSKNVESIDPEEFVEVDISKESIQEFVHGG